MLLSDDLVKTVFFRFLDPVIQCAPGYAQFLCHCRSADLLHPCFDLCQRDLSVTSLILQAKGYTAGIPLSGIIKADPAGSTGFNDVAKVPAEELPHPPSNTIMANIQVI